MTGFSTPDEAIRLANDTEYGLSATIRTRDLQGGPEMSIGGLKQSGLGHEAGLSGVSEYTEVKSVLVDLGARRPWVKAA